MKLKYQFETVDMGEEIVAVPVGKDAERIHGVLKLNQSGKEILDLLSKEATEAFIIEKLTKKYDNDHNALSSNVYHFIEELRTLGLIDE